VLLRLSYLALTGLFAALRLLPVRDADKDIEILALRHQLAMLQRQTGKPRLTPSDWAFLAALLHRLPRPGLARLHLIVSPRRCCAGTAICSVGATPNSPGRNGPAGHPTAAQHQGPRPAVVRGGVDRAETARDDRAEGSALWRGADRDPLV
jgi:hypothetical protein